MAGVDIDILTMEQNLALSRENQAPGVVKPKIEGNVNFEIKSQFMRELREDTFSGNKDKDVHDHIDQGPIPGMTPAQALTAIQTMADHSQKWHDVTTSKNIRSSSSNDRLAALVNKLENLGRDMKKLKESVHAIQVGCQICKGPHLDKDCPINEKVIQVKEEAVTKTDKNEDCKAIFTIDGAPLYTPFYYSPKEIEYFLANSGFSDDDEFKNVTSIPDEDLKQTSPKQTTTHYIEPYVPPIPFPRRLEQHSEEALIHKTMERLKKIKSNRPFLKEIRQSDEYPKYMKDMVTNKPLTIENENIRMNRRCSALLLNQLPPKEKDPGSFILPCSIGRLDFNNALADLGASINIMPFYMYNCLGIGKLETIQINIELADNSKCISKGIVRNLLIKIDKFILPIYFIELDVLEDFRMPVILGRPLLTTAYAKVDVLKKSISLEVGNKKVIFKMKNDLPDKRNESVLMIKINLITEEDELMNIESDLFTYTTNTCESCHILAIDTDLFTYEVVTQETHDEIAHKCCLTAQEAIGTSDDENDIEGIIEYLEPTSYEGFIDLDEEEYNKRRCRLLGMPYIEPLPIIIEQVKLTRYSLGPGEVDTKLEVSNMEELPRSRNNVATLRRNIMDEVFENYEDEMT
ncbi:zinc knuckle CX2CX4HX4C containing protein [Tanacetum coccineum]